MSKELEAFMKYAPIIPNENDFKCWSDYEIALQKYERYLQTFTKTYELLKKALTPPTADEVCEALSEYLKAEVKYSPHKIKKNGFYLVDSGLYLVSLGDDNQVNFSYNNWVKFNQLPPSLIIIIGRFYEGVKKAAEQPKQNINKALTML